jgi:ATP-dependent Zn protease
MCEELRVAVWFLREGSQVLFNLLTMVKVGYYFVEDDEVNQLSSEQRAIFDREVRSLIEQSTQRVRTLLETHRAELERIKEALLEYETITGEELKRIIRGEKIRAGLVKA